MLKHHIKFIGLDFQGPLQKALKNSDIDLLYMSEICKVPETKLPCEESESNILLWVYKSIP